jgi:hypothetical protein
MKDVFMREEEYSSKEQKVVKGIIQDTFDFLGFTFYYGKSRFGKIVPKLNSPYARVDIRLLCRPFRTLFRILIYPGLPFADAHFDLGCNITVPSGLERLLRSEGPECYSPG